ncbi:hypothetical protein BX264_7107 [Streptomyces sp. 2333.5]|uniref:hypothetical protein n=1 Tax=unclassified Streptomyces TaxID=2593676 RepID=UPI000898486B|nr:MULTISPECIES: hypothetical protein [unclassified Streptomyces]PJJ06568.1 hypothetical protein BX264_7107 [Streptomyces sp. 2333.5]SEE97027.1 hypothetical protein SAMN05428943_7206 [Streptomyces sp. 2314.4]SEF11165.1 hypothetical protein SAMN05428942_7207 [Streptomyces sp. 2112.2]
MILVLASRGDAGARQLVDTWGPGQARLLTVDDLSYPGWRIHTEDPAASRAVVQGEVVEVGEITGVVTRLPAVTVGEIRRIRAEDRDYAASEMSAFLTYWLSVLPCPVLNPPTAAGLCGPGWRTEQWVMAARRLGIPVRPHTRELLPYLRADPDGHGSSGNGAPGLSAGGGIQVTVIGDRCIGGEEHGLTGAAQALAATAGVPMLTTVFEEHGSEVRFVDAHPWTNAFDPRIADATLAYFQRSGTAPVLDAPEGE